MGKRTKDISTIDDGDKTDLQVERRGYVQGQMGKLPLSN
jgi:hypothetical protein